MKRCLPNTTKVSKEAKECVQECTSEFISFITSEAVDRCSNEKRKTINGEDVLFAMTTLGFENYSEALKIYLTKYREVSRSVCAIERRERLPYSVVPPLLPSFPFPLALSLSADSFNPPTAPKKHRKTSGKKE
jgi:nuclear transcription Y subunit beta